MLIGYARASSDDPNLDLQRENLVTSGCERVFEDTACGLKTQCVGLTALMNSLRERDIVVVCRLDCLGSPLKDLIRLVAQLGVSGVDLRSLQENIDTGSADSSLVFQFFTAMAEFERDLSLGRAGLGLSTARWRVQKPGRKKLLNANKLEQILSLYNDRKHTVAEICRQMGIGRTTFYTYLANIEQTSQRLSRIRRSNEDGR